MISPSAMACEAISPLPFFWSKYLTRTFGVHKYVSRVPITREEGYIGGSGGSRFALVASPSPLVCTPEAVAEFGPAPALEPAPDPTIRPKPCSTFLVLFSLTSHPGYVDRRSTWTLAIPICGLAALMVVSALVSSLSVGEIVVRVDISVVAAASFSERGGNRECLCEWLE